MSRDAERARAKALNAADARELLNRQLPVTSKVLTPDRLIKCSGVLDAVVVNPAVE